MDNIKIINDEYAVPLKYMQAGTKILAQAPFALVPYPSEQLHRCNYCLKKEKLQCCSRCHSAYFCGQDCFVSSWVQFHHSLCEPSVTLDVEESLLARTAVIIHSIHTLINKINKDQQLFMDLIEMEQQKETHLTQSEEKKIKKVADLLNSLFTFEQLATIYRVIQLNSFSITDPDSMHLDPIAVGLYPTTSHYIRHACTPNAAWVYKGSHQILVAIQDIPQDTPITVSFTSLVATREQRLQSLRARFGNSFVCNCSRCDGEYSDLDKILERPCSMSIDQMKEAFTRQIKEWDKDVCQLAHDICRRIAPEFYVAAYNNQSVKEKSFTSFIHHQLPPYLANNTQEENARRIVPLLHSLSEKETTYFSLQTVQVAEKLYPELIQEGKWIEASRCIMYLLMTYRLVYPALYPKLVYHRLLVCRTTWNSLVQLELTKHSGKEVERMYEKGVLLYIEAAKFAISKVFGKNSSMWKEVVEIQWLYERDQKLK